MKRLAFALLAVLLPAPLAAQSWEGVGVGVAGVGPLSPSLLTDNWATGRGAYVTILTREAGLRLERVSLPGESGGDLAVWSLIAEYMVRVRVFRKVRPYLAAGVGMARVGPEYFEAEGIHPDPKNEFSCGLTGGAVVPIGPSMALDVAGAWTFVAPSSSGSTAEYALLRVGLVFDVRR